MNKAWVLLGACMLLTIGLVSATTECVKTNIFEDEIKEYQKMPVIMQLVNVFEDGYHVMNFTDTSLVGNDYFTVKKVDGRVIWLRKGNCADTSYKTYNIQTDNKKVFDTFSNKEVDNIYESYKVMNQIEGLTIYQKLIFLKIALLNQEGLSNINK